MKTDLEIAYDTDVKPIKEIAAKIGISEDDLVPYGKYIAKVIDANGKMLLKKTIAIK